MRCLGAVPDFSRGRHIDVVGCDGLRSGVVFLSLRAQAVRLLGYGWSRTVQEVIQFYIKSALWVVLHNLCKLF